MVSNSSSVPVLKNDEGAKSLWVSVRRFRCIGASAPHDHPHIFLNMGDANSIRCPYCATLYKLRKNAR